MAKKTAPVSTGKPTAEPGFEYHVNYLDPEIGRVQVEEFDDLAAAERFASMQLRSEDCWAVVERIDINGTLRLVA